MGTVLIDLLLSTQYVQEALVVDPTSVEISSNILKSFIRDVKFWFSANPFLWTALYLVKFSFLFFFKQLVVRMNSMNLYVKVVMGICGLSYLNSLVEVAIECPFDDARVGKYFCVSSPGVVGMVSPVTFPIVTCWDRYHQAIAIVATNTCLDIITDLMSKELNVPL